MEANVGIQVLISSHNCEEYLEDCFNSIEIAFNGYKWMMVFCDDASADNTESVVNTYKTTTSADNIVYQKFEKASIVGKAKNRACLLSRAYKDDYPVICFMDSDDTMGAQRISGLLPELSEDYPIVFGDFVEQQKNENVTQTHLKMEAETINKNYRKDAPNWRPHFGCLFYRI